MDSSIVTAAAAVMGSLVGALASLTSTWFTQRIQSRRDYIARQIARREALYSEFINEAAQLYNDALVRNLEKPEGMAKIWSLVSRMRLSSSAAVVAEADAVMQMIADQFLAENLAIGEIRKLYARRDPLERFGAACRAELDELDSDR